MPPVADAGPDQSVDEGATVTLDGTNSTDPNNNIASYLWEQTEGPVVDLSVFENGIVTFGSPDVDMDGASLSFRLTVTDSAGLQAEDNCIVNVSWVNVPPTADAAGDQIVDEGFQVALNGTNSTDPDDGIAAYRWEQIGGTPVDISNATEPEASFVAPDAYPDDVSLTFQLTVEDAGGLKSTDTCVVNVSWINEPPVADAGPDQTVDESATVTLDGTNSRDPDDSIAFVRWKQLSGTPVTFSNPEVLKANFNVPQGVAEDESMVFQLTVTDSGGLSSQDACTVMIAQKTVYEDAEDGEISGWTIYNEGKKEGSIRNVIDHQRNSRVIKLKGDGTTSLYVLQTEDGIPWHNSKNLILQWSMAYSEYYEIYVDVETNVGQRYLVYMPDNDGLLDTAEYVHYALGLLSTSGEWQTYTRDLQADLEAAQPGVSILEVNGFMIRGSGRVDDIQLMQR